MTASAAPQPQLAGGGGSYVPTRREIEAHLLRAFPKLTRSAANRTARAALDLRKVIDIDVAQWAEADVNRRRLLAGLPLLLKGFDPTGTMAARNIDQAVARS